ncbi:MAG: class I SAM-dependent methyltransferase [Deltaproteobacteria bacterium]|nr:class I SAM-dependent methyltransferase [Deltaproteobacteria bacterium]
MKVHIAEFRQRQDRYRYLVQEFQRFLAGTVLDVGCDQAVLRAMLPAGRYIGIDIGGDADLRLDLEKMEKLPFGDCTYDCVVCLDVLEHLDNLHAVFGELVRVSKAYVIVSLPNNWANARRPIRRGRGSIGHYGLPVSPIADRHKWFFNLSEALDFIRGQEKRYPLRIIDVRVNEKPRPYWVRTFRRLAYRSIMRYLDRYAHTLWIVMEKQPSPIEAWS